MPITGTIQPVRGDTLFLTSKAGVSRSLPLSQVARLDVRLPLSADERLLRTRLGGVGGLVTGAGIGYLIAIPQVRHGYAQHNWFAGAYYLGDPIIGAVVGLAIGAATGNLWSDHWVTRYP